MLMMEGDEREAQRESRQAGDRSEVDGRHMGEEEAPKPPDEAGTEADIGLEAAPALPDQVVADVGGEILRPPALGGPASVLDRPQSDLQLRLAAGPGQIIDAWR